MHTNELDFVPPTMDERQQAENEACRLQTRPGDAEEVTRKEKLVMVLFLHCGNIEEPQPSMELDPMCPIGSY
jgi:hypothetical protein